MIGVKTALFNRSASEKVGVRDGGPVDKRSCTSIVSIIIDYKVYGIPLCILIN
jgi:hypothetical protein